ncbi:MAG: glycosyltransferase family 2 protein [Sphingobacteriales bacterium]|jgi:glycosyltransferase involved in cell wall biosynthesis|nr:glycosyltransferase family 2 protein [Sphingobacteriales bacterium]
MNKISIIILAKNSAATIERAIMSVRQISNDILVIDSGSEDDTLTIASKLNARIHHITWQGYGAARNTGAKEALYDYVFCLDSDEEISRELAQSINNLKLIPHAVYGCKRFNFLGEKKILYGEWGNDYVFRLYNRNSTSWNLNLVHETLEHNNLKRIKVHGAMFHYTTPDITSFRKKLKQYALLNAENYFDKKKKAGFFKRSVSPSFNFINNFIFKLGFLDGKEGLEIAKANYQYNKEKYLHLKRIQNQASNLKK